MNKITHTFIGKFILSPSALRNLADALEAKFGKDDNIEIEVGSMQLEYCAGRTLYFKLPSEHEIRELQRGLKRDPITFRNEDE